MADGFAGLFGIDSATDTALTMSNLVSKYDSDGDSLRTQADFLEHGKRWLLGRKWGRRQWPAGGNVVPHYWIPIVRCTIFSLIPIAEATAVSRLTISKA